MTVPLSALQRSCSRLISLQHGCLGQLSGTVQLVPMPWSTTMHASMSTTTTNAAAAKHQHQSQQRDQQHDQPLQASADVFTRSLQSRTEQEVFSLLEKARAAKQAEEAAESAGDDDMVDVVNPETGEVDGPRGKEPTRFGDWEIKGRCTDFA